MSSRDWKDSKYQGFPIVDTDIANISGNKVREEYLTAMKRRAEQGRLAVHESNHHPTRWHVCHGI